MTTLIDLPIEILQVILSYVSQQDLYHCAVVHVNLTMPATCYLWRMIHLRHRYYCGFCFLSLMVMARHSVGRWIHHLHLVDFPWSDTTLKIALREAPLLKSLVLGDAARTTDASMQLIHHYAPQLQSLSLDSPEFTSISYQSLGQLANLTSLQLWNCRLSPNTFLLHFVNSPLEQLMLAPWVDEDAEEEEDESIDLTGLHQLTHIQLHGGNFTMFNQAITSDNQSKAHYPWPRLTSVMLEAATDMDDVAATALLHDLPPGLTCLGIKDAGIGDTTLDNLPKFQPGLIELDISYSDQFTLRGIQDLVEGCRQLRMINLAYCGFNMYDLPKAGQECQGTVVTTEGTVARLDHLNEPAIQALRRRIQLGEV